MLNRASRALTLSALVLAVVVPGCSKGGHGGGGTPAPTTDTTAPGAIADLASTAQGSTTIDISWTAPFEDGASGGAATTYDVRISTTAITDDATFAAASVAAGSIPSPSTPGTTDTMQITGLTASTTYFIAIKSSDEVPNASALSNVVSATTTTPDVTAPGQITTLATGAVTADSIVVSWTAVGDDGALGTASAYDFRYSTTAITNDTDFGSAIPVVIPAPLATGSPESFTVTGLLPATTYFFAIKAIDEVPNTGLLSSPNPSGTTSATTDLDGPGACTAFSSTGDTDSSVTLQWTAPDEDGTTPVAPPEAATTYDMRYAVGGSITFSSATLATGEPVPAAPGTVQSMVVTGLLPGTTYTFQIMAIDADGNLGALSGTVTVTTDAFPTVPTLTEPSPDTGANDTAAGATPLPIGTAGVGTLDTATDVDYWSFSATAGDVISVELYGTRLSQASWNSSAAVPHLSIRDSADANLTRHDRGPWANGDHDLDVPLVRIPTTGTYYLRLQASNGSVTPPPSRQYAVLVKTVALSTTAETEAAGATGGNDTLGTAQAITTPTTVFGWHVDGESDYFSFPVTAGSILHFTITAYRNGIYTSDTAYFNPRLRLYRPAGNQVKNVANSFFRDVEFTFRASETGTYTVRVMDDGSSTGDGAYFLRVDVTASGTATEVDDTLNNALGTTTDTLTYGGYVNGSAPLTDVDYYSFSGTQGDMVFVKIYDSVINQGAAGTVGVSIRDASDVALPSTGPSGTINIVRTILQTTGTHYVRVAAGGTSTSYAVELILYKSSLMETEANDTGATADAVDANRRASGVIATAGDVDYFVITATAGELVTVDIYAAAATAPGSNGDSGRSGWGSTLTPVLDVFDAPGAATPIATTTAAAASVSGESVTQATPTLAVSFIASTTGSYYVRVGSSTGGGSPTDTYVIERR
jgi:hypothetical protein